MKQVVWLCDLPRPPKTRMVYHTKNDCKGMKTCRDHIKALLENIERDYPGISHCYWCKRRRES